MSKLNVDNKKITIDNKSSNNDFNPLVKLNKLRCLIINLEHKLKDNNIQLPYSIFKDFSEIVETSKF